MTIAWAQGFCALVTKTILSLSLIGGFQADQRADKQSLTKSDSGCKLRAILLKPH
jgi:hypothetical protein